MGIPQTVRASKAVLHAERYGGELTVAQLRRLADAVPGGGTITAEWQAGRSADGGGELTGRIGGSLRLGCQRCLKQFDWPIDIDLRLRLVGSDAEQARLLHDFDPYLVSQDELPLRELTEDEILLALPLMPRCKTCENAATSQSPAKPPDAPQGPNPFAALRKLKF